MSVTLVTDSPVTGPSGRRYARMGTPSTLVIQRAANTTSATPTPRFSRWRAMGGATVGASVPISVFAVSHLVPFEWSFQPLLLWAAVLGGLVFSAGTVYRYCTRLFRGDSRKAVAYCVLSETIMTFAPDWLWPLSIAMLTILVTINAVETGRVAGGVS